MSTENLSQAPAGTPKKSSFRYYFLMMTLGVSCTTTLVSIYMPKVLLWYFDPPSQIGVSCISSIDWAIQRLQIAQGAALVLGAILGLILGFRLRRR